MKKLILIAAFLTAVTMFFSCNKTGGSAPSQTGEKVSVSTAKTGGVVNQGYALRVNAGLYMIDGEDSGDAATKTKWVAGLIIGETVSTGKARRLTFSGKEYDFIEVRRDNKSEGFALVSQIAVGGRLAVVTDEKANLFSAPKTVNVTNTIIARRTVLVYFPETENGGFVEVRGIDCENGAVIPENRYMRLSSLSRNEPDIQSSILLQTALIMTGAGQKIARETLLDSALKDYPDSVFYSQIRAIVYPDENKPSYDDEDDDY